MELNFYGNRRIRRKSVSIFELTNLTPNGKLPSNGEKLVYTDEDTAQEWWGTSPGSAWLPAPNDLHLQYAQMCPETTPFRWNRKITKESPGPALTNERTEVTRLWPIVHFLPFKGFHLLNI